MAKPIHSLNPFSFRYIATAGMVSLLLFSQGVVGIASASAKVVNRAQGRCKLFTNDAVTYDGHCVIKHKEDNQGDELDDNFLAHPQLNNFSIHFSKLRLRKSVHELFKVSGSCCHDSASRCHPHANYCPRRNSY